MPLALSFVLVVGEGARGTLLDGGCMVGDDCEKELSLLAGRDWLLADRDWLPLLVPFPLYPFCQFFISGVWLLAQGHAALLSQSPLRVQDQQT